MEHVAYLALGTNLGDKERNITEAYQRIEEKVGRIERKSSLYRSKPWGFTSQNDFVNTVICCSTNLTPRQLLEATKGIERDMGRMVKSQCGEYYDRIIDIDIILYDKMAVEEPDLHIPHPLMKERPFVMNPLEEIYKDEQTDDK